MKVKIMGRPTPNAEALLINRGEKTLKQKKKKAGGVGQSNIILPLPCVEVEYYQWENTVYFYGIAYR
jgi:hypothetical protein